MFLCFVALYDMFSTFNYLHNIQIIFSIFQEKKKYCLKGAKQLVCLLEQRQKLKVILWDQYRENNVDF